MISVMNFYVPIYSTVLISGERCVVSHKMMEHLGDLGKLTGV